MLTGNTSTSTVTIIVNSVNDVPVAVNDNTTTPEDTPVTIPVLGNDTDADGDPLSVTEATSPDGTVVINADGTITFTPNPNFNGIATITYTISDGNGGTSTATVTVNVTPVNDPPVAVNDNAGTPEDTPVTIPVLANDTDIDGNSLTVTAANSPDGTVVINADGTITFTPNPNFNGIATITYTISDGNGGTSTATVTVNVTPVNDPPVAGNDNTTTPEDTPVTVPVLANDFDIDGDPLTVTGATSPDGTVVINADGTITFTPIPNFNGVATITYTISDGNGGTSTATVTVNVTPVNDVPVATPIAPQSNVDSSVISLPVAGNFSDIDGDPLTYTASGLPPGLSIDPVTGVISGTLTRDASQPNGGVYSVTVNASDGKGGIVSVTFTWTVTNPPPAAGNDNVKTPEDTPVTIPVLANDNDPDGDPLTVTGATSPDGTVVINADGTITFTPNPNFNGIATITYTISDGNGGTSTAIVAVNVTPVNDVPVATPIAPQSNVDSAVISLPVAGNFSDVDGDPLNYTASGLPPGLSIDPVTGVISGALARDASQPNGGVYSVTVNASDGKGGIVSVTFTWTVTNPPPAARNDSGTTAEDTPVTIPVLANDNDPDGDPLTVTGATSPDGTVVINADGTITFIPNPNFNGIATITYTISDGNGGTSTATVRVTVVAVNDPPVAIDDIGVTPVETPIVIPVLANDRDPDGNPLIVTVATSPDGTVTINPDGTITFTPAPNFTGIAVITYTISDGNGGTSTATVRINVIGASFDINALLGTKPVGIPDGWRVDGVRDQYAEFIDAPLIINDTVNEFRSLNGTPSLFGHRPLLTAINGLGWLRGTSEHGPDGHPIEETINYLDRVRDIRFGYDRLFDPRWGDFLQQSLTGFSVRQLSTGHDQLMVESVVRDRVIYMEIRDIGADADPRIVEYQLRTRDGSPLPEWITMDKRGLAIIERPVDADEIQLVVKAIRADGKVFEIPVVVQGATGEIQLDTPLPSAKISAADTLSKTLAAATAAANDETATLAAAFSSQA